MADIILALANLWSVWIETMFVVPFKNFDMLWILVPVWLGWFFAEFYQEKTGTSLGNAITNAVLVLWASIDCTRQTVKLISEGAFTSTVEIYARFGLIGLIFLYSAIIIYLGIKGNHIVKYIGRVRVVTYVFMMFIPVFYNAIPFSIEHFVACIVFFPLYYVIIEVIDRIVPDPKAVVIDSGLESKEKPAVQQVPQQPAMQSAQLQHVHSPYAHHPAHQHHSQQNTQQASQQYAHAQSQQYHPQYTAQHIHSVQQPIINNQYSPAKRNPYQKSR